MAQKGAGDISGTRDDEKTPDTHEGLANQKHEHRPEDLKLLDLTDDCLLAILSYLEREDLISLRLAHFRFHPLFIYTAKRRDLSFRRFILSPSTVAEYPPETSMDVYNALGEITEGMQVLNVDEDVIQTVLPCFKNLEELVLEARRLKNVKAIDTFPMVKILNLDTGDTHKSYLNALLRRSASTLTRLECQSAPRAEFELLPNLEILYMEGIRLGKKSRFWSTNKSLREINLMFNGDPEDPNSTFHDWNVVRDNLRNISQMENMTKLGLYGVGEEILTPKIIPRFDHLTKLDLVIHGMSLLLPLISNVGPLLSYLRIQYFYTYPVTAIQTHFIFVEGLEVIGTCFPALMFLEIYLFDTGETVIPFTEEETQPLYALTRLNTLNIALDSPEATYALFRNIPSLKAVDPISKNYPATSISPEFTEYLKKENRRVQIFGLSAP